MKPTTETITPPDSTRLGFWIYIMTDCVLFASLFATYIVLHGTAQAGVMTREIFELPFVFVETLLLLASSLTSGFALLCAKDNNRTGMIVWLAATFILGAGFLGMELYEFSTLAAEGYGWTIYSSLSAFFTLVGVHGAHIFVGLLWIVFMVAYTRRRGLTHTVVRRLGLFTMFWHFLDVIWIFIFSIVYLMGVL